MRVPGDVCVPILLQNCSLGSTHCGCGSHSHQQHDSAKGVESRQFGAVSVSLSTALLTAMSTAGHLERTIVWWEIVSGLGLLSV